MKILVVEDEPDLNHIIAKHLQACLLYTSFIYVISKVLLLNGYYNSLYFKDLSYYSPHISFYFSYRKKEPSVQRF